MPRPKQRTPELRERLLEVAVATLNKGGVAGFTTRKVAEGASTSIPAVYELFGDRAGLVREIFFEGFRRLGERLEAVVESRDPRADIEKTIEAFRAFSMANPHLARVMFARPFADFDPGPEELAVGIAVQRRLVSRVHRCIESKDVAGDPIDVAHALLSLAHGLAGRETAGALGSSKASIDRRWTFAIRAMLDGLRPPGSKKKRAPRSRSAV